MASLKTSYSIKEISEEIGRTLIFRVVVKFFSIILLLLVFVGVYFAVGVFFVLFIFLANTAYCRVIIIPTSEECR